MQARALTSFPILCSPVLTSSAIRAATRHQSVNKWRKTREARALQQPQAYGLRNETSAHPTTLGEGANGAEREAADGARGLPPSEKPRRNPHSLPLTSTRLMDTRSFVFLTLFYARVSARVAHKCPGRGN